MRLVLLIVSIVTGLAMSSYAWAQDMSVVSDEGSFVEMIGGKKLTRFGIKLEVFPTGEIVGRAFGTPVTGAWEWEDGLFCRDLFFGDRDLGANCQLVQVNGKTMRFTSDAGAGDFADFGLED